MKSRLLAMKSIRKRFRLPQTKEQVIHGLLASCMAEVEYRGMQYKPSDETNRQLERVATWLTEGNKVALLISGKCGNGKTTLARAIMGLVNYTDPRNSYGDRISMYMVNAKDVVEQSKGHDEKQRQLYKNHCTTDMLAIDDLGTEPTEVLQFGNISNPITDLLSIRYDKQLFTVITTNLTPEQLKEKYGERVYDRLKEMACVLAFKNNSFR